ncbi:DNA-binding protein [Limosilactobacillus reuteri]|uniref:DNA-binding protein n=1 Tax=Limosilactobacillus reuteri TaxID=1598 RepID=A0A317GH48_LIMRT|nr:Arc family DNA-binding protein [Limosilactobacillus reuteri]MCH5385873.1 Arc family DNA-binding protein [Limosilactobacillus reuteri]PWT29595.1 DNA-binding protein [Limosilactobacillus reuteri]PWT46653.1 DNA-binding protein [Limosilactobacillus reuteri]PWT51211.1 DNA-binding protein [Limosilactobacillus reuteri]PWT58199.1 DNA-binding protein [Limosilactobacillus reuteri]
MAETKNFTMRMPVEMYQEIKSLAEKNFRPLSKEILVAVQEHLEKNNKN